MIEFLRRLRRPFRHLLETLVLLLMISLAVVVIAGVTFRKAGATLVWYDEIASVLLVWLTYYGACLAAMSRAHIGFPKLVSSAGPRLRTTLLVFRELAIVLFFGIAAWAGWQVLQILGDTTLVSLPWLPARVTQSVIPISSVLFILAELLSLIPEAGVWKAESEG